MQCLLQYLGKYAFMKRATRFWKVPRQTNAYVSNKWPLKLPCAYLNTQGSGPFENRLKRIGGVLCNISLFWASRFSFIFGPVLENCKISCSLVLVVFAKICETFILINGRIVDEIGSEFVCFLQ
ncbi:hypothetical protein T03_14648 [Trichinella britovi]|uniref:Uncharacterized protein n=1 Tax=Trichinella britovi TaxID=45882 RepID=A0A0V1DDF2_TRIBR|nr:hypothetical protein T03_14648 [Trichinella britovi]